MVTSFSVAYFFFCLLFPGPLFAGLCSAFYTLLPVGLLFECFPIPVPWNQSELASYPFSRNLNGELCLVSSFHYSLKHFLKLARPFSPISHSLLA
jgi:hypothetical protein